MLVQFSGAKIYGSLRCIQQPGISVPLLDRSSVATIGSGQPLDCSGR